MAAERATPFTKLSVFFPMWNEEAYIDRAIETATTECRSLMERNEILDYELIIVDDASTDHTGKLADEMAAVDPHIRVVHHPVNRKLGGSMKTGFATATGDVVLYSDADLPFDMAELSRAIRLMRYYDADIVSAFRFDRTGEGSLRTVYTFFYNFLIRRLFGVRMRDINFALQAVPHVDLRPHLAAQRGFVHRRGADHPGQEAGLQRHPVRCRLLPAHQGREHPGVAQRDPQDHQRNGAPAAGAA